MSYLSCPKCKAPYSVFEFTITLSQCPVNVCVECGWKSLDYFDPAEKYFTGMHYRKYWHYVLDHLNTYIPGIDEDLAKTLFRGSVSCNPGEYGRQARIPASLMIRSFKAFNAPYRAYRSGTGRAESILEEAHAPDLTCLMTDSYRMPVLFVVATASLALRLRYYSALMEGAPAQVFFYSRCNARSYTVNSGFFQPERMIGIGLTDVKKDTLRKQIRAPLFTYDAPPPEPLHAFVRTLENEVLNADISSFGDDPSKYVLDTEKVRRDVESLDIAVHNPKEQVPSMFPEGIIPPLWTIHGRHVTN